MDEILILSALLLFTVSSSRTGVGSIRKTRFIQAYSSAGQVNKALGLKTSGGAGVYLIKDRGQLAYIGYSGTNLYKTFTRHFQSWDDPQQQRVTYPQAAHITARIVYTRTAQQAAALERALILKYRPKDNPNKLTSYEMEPKHEKIIEQHYEECPF